MEQANKKNQKVPFDSIQEVQDNIFRKMSVDRKIKLASKLTMFCLELNRLNRFGKPTINGNNRPKKTEGND